MGKKRRSDKHHDIGDPMPGTTGDKSPSQDPGDSPMQRIHNRRHGELKVPEPNKYPREGEINKETEGDPEKEEEYDYESKGHLADIPEEGRKYLSH